MRHEVPVASPTTPIAELARLMVEHRVPGLPVIAHGELVGIVTEADLIQREATRRHAVDRHVSRCGHCRGCGNAL